MSMEKVTLGRTGLKVSRVGFGGYRVSAGVEPHREALRAALEGGCNLIDTSTNYTNGDSERLIGIVLCDLFAGGKLKREDVVVVSKAGYVQGDNLELAHERKRTGRAFAEMTEYSDECWHCISPEFLEDQITRSLDRLQLDQLDVLLLHNPEYFLKTEGDHREYYRRIRAAFEHLEKEVRDGRIRWYGISSNTFPDPKESPEYTSLEMALELAQEVGGSGHHFGVIQFPFNLYEPGAALEANNSGQTVIEYARAHRIGTLINRPLNAFSAGHLFRLADFAPYEATQVMGDFKDALTRAMELESRYTGSEIVPAGRIAWGHIIKKNFDQLSELDRWRGVLAYQIQPSLEDAFERLMRHDEQRSWVTAYRPVVDELLESFTALVEAGASEESRRLTNSLVRALPELRASETLSRKAIRIYLSLGVDCVLVGMRQTRYVEDALGSLSDEAPLLSREKAEAALKAAVDHDTKHHHPHSHE